VVVIDTDVLLLAFAFQNDPRRTTNNSFLQRVQGDQPAITVYNLMEILGQLSYNLSPQYLKEWPSWLINAYQLVVIWPAPMSDIGAINFREEKLLSRFKHLMNI